MVSLLGQGGHTFCESSFHERPSGAGALGVLGGALAARAEANANWNRARDQAVATNNHMNLPNGTHRIGNLIVKATNNNIIYKNPDTGQHWGIVKETGERYTFSAI
jgi:hypothetical protein